MVLNKKTVDIIELILFPLIAATISYGLQLNFFWSIILFFGLPSAYLSYRSPKFIKRSAVFSFLIAIPAVIMVDYVAHATKQWIVPETIFPMRLFGEVPFEDLFLAFFNFYIVIMYYQHFLDRQYSKTILPKSMIRPLTILLVAMIIFLSMYIFFPSKFMVHYFYLWIGTIVFLIPVCIQLYRHPKLASKFFWSGIYFFYLTIIYEIVAQIMKWWVFPNPEVAGWVSIFRISFPVEELIFWIIISSLTIITAFEKYEEGTT